MPFVQRVVQPTRLANTAANPSGRTTTFFCSPGKCKNNNCINKRAPPSAGDDHESAAKLPLGNDCESADSARAAQHSHGDVSRTRTYVKDIVVHSESTVTAIVHAPSPHRGAGDDVAGAGAAASSPIDSLDVTDHTHVHVNGYATSFSYATDNEDDILPALAASPAHSVRPLSPTLQPMKKLKQHAEFLSASPTRSSHHTTTTAVAATKRRPPTTTSSNATSGATTPQSPTAAKIISGYEFESISNITLSNALRQLASLVLLASDIFDDLQRELLHIGERSRTVQRKIVAVEQRVATYDPKTVTVPESDLLTFAQRKCHYESDKSLRKELFTADNRPRSVRVLYDEAGKKSPPPTPGHASTAASPQSAGSVNITDAGANLAAGSAEPVCTSIFGEANRKMRDQIDAEIEIRLPAAHEDMRKWTSAEALGDVTVTPDCMHHVDSAISTSLVIGDNGVLTPALSPSVLSADAVDAMYSMNISSALDATHMPSDVNKDVPLNHRLPSPEEQCKIIALRYPAEVISVDTSGKRFQRMCAARKSTTGCYTHMADSNNLNDEVQTVSRRSRSRKARGKRRNTIAGIDQKEIQDAANGDATAGNEPQASGKGDEPAGELADSRGRSDKAKKFGRSKSSDILKKESVALPYDKGKSSLTRLNSLKQWGRNRFKFMQRNDVVAAEPLNNAVKSDGASVIEKNLNSTGASAAKATPSKLVVERAPATAKGMGAGGDIDEDCTVHDLISQKSESRFSHERKPSYSSSEKSMSVSSSGHLRGRLHLATCGNVKLRDSSSLNRQRRNGMLVNGGLAGKDEQPHSSSGNWSASSESGRASIGSEITIQPKSSASNTSLNVSSFHPSSGPPSSMLSRRRFMNTSASSSVTSEGTATPDLQALPDTGYPNHLDDETSSAYSCDTEGYYTSFHMDSGLRTLKEEETSGGSGQSMPAANGAFSFGGPTNQSGMSAENEYELFGRGSTSTTTSSAGTVCTTLLVGGGPDVPERISSLGKLNRSDNSTTASTSTLERSHSSSTIGSTLERTGTIKRNVNATPRKQAPEEAEDDDKPQAETPESVEEEFDFAKPLQKRPAQPIPAALAAEVDCSESSDLEGVERIERIKQKTQINAKRIPSMCIITPSTSDDENQTKEVRQVSPKASHAVEPKDHNHNVNETKRHSNYGFNGMFEKLRVVLPNLKGGRGKSSPADGAGDVVDDDALYDTAGEYVTIADISNNNRLSRLQAPKAGGGRGIYYSNDIVRQRHVAADDPTNAGEYAVVREETEYVSLNELPYNLRKFGAADRPATVAAGSSKSDVETSEAASAGVYATVGDESEMSHGADAMQHDDNRGKQSKVAATPASAAVVPMYAEIGELRDDSGAALPPNKGARVRVNAQGKIIYDSDSLKRRKGGHSTFAPGPYVKETESALADASQLRRIDPTGKELESTAAASASTETKTGESVLGVKVKKENLVPNTPAAKLLLLNGGIAVTRKVANVRPIVAKSPLSQIQRCSTYSAPVAEKKDLDDDDMSITTTGPFHRPNYYHQDNKNAMANRDNPLYNKQNEPVAMMASPSTKSTSSTGSTVSSNTSTASSQASNSSKDEVYQRFYKMSQQPENNLGVADAKETGSIYWTLQNRKHTKTPPSAVTCRDDLYATPIRKSDRVPRAANASNVSSISPRVANDFQTSTPTRQPNSGKPLARNASWDENSPERFNTCSDRIGQSKTSLMDFKKLLLAKSAKTSPIPKKVSAVELLKKGNVAANTPPAAASAGKVSSDAPTQSLDSSMKLLDLSGSPKTFASRRMLRQGQFGSPSKSFVPKLKPTTKGGTNWRQNIPVPHTDIMSTAIVEDNIEDDHTTQARKSLEREPEDTTDSVTLGYNIKENFFMQSEANRAKSGGDKASPLQRQSVHSDNLYVATNAATRPTDNRFMSSPGAVSSAGPALETAL